MLSLRNTSIIGQKRDFDRAKATDINFTIDKLLNKDQTVVNENANKDSDVFNTQRDLTAGIVGKSIGLKMLPAHVANAHQKGDIHYHDLDYSPYTLMTNCHALSILKGCWRMVSRLEMLRLKVLSLFKQRQLRFRKSLPMWLQASMAVVRQTALMNF